MQILFRILSITGLALTLIPSILVFLGTIDLPQHKTLMLVGMLLWFATAPLLSNRQRNEQAAE